MKQAKRVLAVLLALAAATLLLAGCTGTPAVQDGASADAAPPAGGTVEKTVLASSDALTVTLLDYDIAGDYGPSFALLLENRGAGALYFTLEDVSVNDVMRDPLWGEAVPAGQSVHSVLYWSKQDLALGGINYITQVEGTLRVYDAASPAVRDVYEGPVAWQVQNEASDLPPVSPVVFEGGIEDIPVIDTASFTATIKDFSVDGEWGPTLTFYLENNSDTDALFFVDAVQVNDQPLPPYWNINVAAGKAAYSRCRWWADDLAAAGIEDIRTITFHFYVADYGGFQRLAEMSMTISVEGAGGVLAQSGGDAQA